MIKLHLQIASVDLYRGSPIEGTENVLHELEHTYTEDQFEAAVTSGAFIVRIQSFLDKNGFQNDVRKLHQAADGKENAFSSPLTETSDRLTYFMASLSRVQPEQTKQASTVAPSTPAADSQVSKVFRKWHGKLNALKKARAELEVNPSRSAEEEIRLQQCIGAVNALSGVMTDLQAIRPVNQSTLNV